MKTKNKKTKIIVANIVATCCAIAVGVCYGLILARASIWIADVIVSATI